MNLDQIKKDIDKVVEDYKENWDNHHNFPDDDNNRLTTAFRTNQVYRCMYWMSIIDMCRKEIKNPIVTPRQNRFTQDDGVGLGITFLWEYDKPDDEHYVKIELSVSAEGSSHVETHYGGEYWTNRIDRAESYHINDIASLLKEETAERGKE